jgi:hypothetical protein
MGVDVATTKLLGRTRETWREGMESWGGGRGTRMRGESTRRAGKGAGARGTPTQRHRPRPIGVMRCSSCLAGWLPGPRRAAGLPCRRQPMASARWTGFLAQRGQWREFGPHGSRRPLPAPRWGRPGCVRTPTATSNQNQRPRGPSEPTSAPKGKTRTRRRLPSSQPTRPSRPSRCAPTDPRRAGTAVGGTRPRNQTPG